MSVLITELDSNITEAQICNLLYRAHGSNREIGLNYGTALIKPDELREKLSRPDAKCFVAITTDGQLVGTSTVSVLELNRWFYKGKVGYIELIGVAPEMRGQHICQKIYKEIESYLREINIHTMLSISAEENLAVKSLFLKNGFKIVKYGAGKSNNFYSLFYMKWMDGCPYSDSYIKFRFLLDKMLHILVFQKGGKRRFF